MKVLTVYAHHNPRSFCHGVLDHFTEGLRDAGHASEVIDLYAIGFDPVFRDRDVASYIADDIPGDILELMDLRAQVMNSCRGPVQRRLAARALRGKSPAGIAALIRRRMPKDVLAQQEKVAWPRLRTTRQQSRPICPGRLTIPGRDTSCPRLEQDAASGRTGRFPAAAEMVA